MYGGRVDLVAWHGADRVLVDRKTGSSFHVSTWLQLEGYRQMWEFWHPDQPISETLVIKIPKTGRPKFVRNPYSHLVANVWTAAVWRYWWLREIGEVKNAEAFT
jgi:hypothetical protein